MDCIICGSWFASTIQDGACPTCSRAIKQLRINMTPNRLIELTRAEKNGRLMVLPCKVEDMVWCISGAYKTISLYTVAGYLNDGFRWKVRMTKTIPSWVGNKTEHKYVAFNAFGKTVFLTREEAEAALEKREEDNEAD